MKPKELERIRADLGLSRAKFAELLGITRGGYSRLENGNRTISKTTEHLAKLIQAIKPIKASFIIRYPTGRLYNTPVRRGR